MRTLTFLAIVVCSIPLLGSSARSEEPVAAPKPAAVLNALECISGTWQGQMWGGVFEAHYSTPAGGKLLSHSRLLKGNRVAFYEFEVFEVMGDKLHYQPYPGGKKAGGFVLAKWEADAKRATFENPKKDFPTRIEFHRATDDTLIIKLSDPHGGSAKVETFNLERKPAEVRPKRK